MPTGAPTALSPEVKAVEFREMLYSPEGDKMDLRQQAMLAARSAKNLPEGARSAFAFEAARDIAQKHASTSYLGEVFGYGYADTFMETAEYINRFLPGANLDPMAFRRMEGTAPGQFIPGGFMGVPPAATPEARVMSRGQGQLPYRP